MNVAQNASKSEGQKTSFFRVMNTTPRAMAHPATRAIRYSFTSLSPAIILAKTV